MRVRNEGQELFGEGKTFRRKVPPAVHGGRAVLVLETYSHEPSPPHVLVTERIEGVKRKTVVQLLTSGHFWLKLNYY